MLKFHSLREKSRVSVCLWFSEISPEGEKTWKPGGPPSWEAGWALGAAGGQFGALNREASDLSHVLLILNLAKDRLLFPLTSFFALVKCCLLQSHHISSSLAVLETVPLFQLLFLISLPSFNLFLKIKTTSNENPES